MYRAQLQLAAGPRFYKEFWIHTLGKKRAFALAVAERKRQLKQAEAYRLHNPRPPRSASWKALNAPEMYGITRVYSSNDQRGPEHSTRGWSVSLHRSNETFGKQFADSTYGGEAEALAAAKAWRDAIVRKHKPLLKRDYAQLVRRNSTTGVAGVTRREDGAQVRYIARTTLPCGKRLMQSFNVAVHGEGRAFKLAVKARKLQLREISGYLLHSEGALSPEHEAQFAHGH